MPTVIVESNTKMITIDTAAITPGDKLLSERPGHNEY